MKKLTIQVVLDEENQKVASVMRKEGFGKIPSFEIIGILQNLIQIEQDKLSTKGQFKINGKN